MIPFKVAFHTVIVLICILGLVFLFLLGYTLWTRLKKQYWQRYKQKFRDLFLPRIFDFVEGNGQSEEADKLIARISKNSHDISFFLELLDEMSELVKGDDRRRLDFLIEHEMFYNFYRDWLFSITSKKQLFACLYFEKNHWLGKRVVAQLIKISKFRSLKLAYAASKALQSSDHAAVRRNALIRFLKRPDPSELMLSELLTIYYQDGERERNEISAGLKNILTASNVGSEKKKLLVLFLADKNFYEHGGFFLHYLKRLQYSEEKSPLIQGLIRALGHLQVVEATPVIKDYFQFDDEQLQLECVQALGQIGGKENLVFLTNLLLQVEFSVRKKIVETIAEHGKTGTWLLNNFLVANQQLIDKLKSDREYSQDLLPLIHRICDTAKGIRITLSKKNKTIASHV